MCAIMCRKVSRVHSCFQKWTIVHQTNLQPLRNGNDRWVYWLGKKQLVITGFVFEKSLFSLSKFSWQKQLINSNSMYNLCNLRQNCNVKNTTYNNIFDEFEILDLFWDTREKMAYKFLATRFHFCWSLSLLLIWQNTYIS